MPKIRILLLDVPPMLRDVILGSLGREEDIEVVGGPGEADVLVVSAPEEEHARVCAELLDRDGRVRVIAIDPESGQASSCRLEPRRSRLGVLPLARLGDAVRSAARPTRVD